jgi:hypothetical protein
VKGKLAPYEYPKEIEFIDALPMTTTGKVQRRVLRCRKKSGDVAGDVEFQAVVGGLADGHAGAHGGLLHRGFLVLHFLGPDIAAAGADSAAQDCARGRALGAAGGRAQQRARDSANAGALGRALTGFRSCWRNRKGSRRPATAQVMDVMVSLFMKCSSG